MELSWAWEPTDREVADLIWAKHPSVVFIAKTWIDKVRLKKKNRIYNLITCSLYFGFIEVGDWF